MGCGFQHDDWVFGVARGGTQVNLGATKGSGQLLGLTGLSGMGTNSTTLLSANIITIDSPSSTSALTYTMTAITSGSRTVYNGRTVEDAAGNSRERASNEIILTEIAG